MIFLKNINEISAALNKESLIVGETDTILGLFGILTEAVFFKLNTLKKRENKSYIILIDEIEKMNLFVEQENFLKMKNFIKEIYCFPVTFILKAKQNLPAFLKFDNKIALRIPNNIFLKKLLSNFDGLFSTSVNLSGATFATSLEEIPDILSEKIYGYFGNIKIERNFERKENQVSTLIDISTDKIEILREGAVSKELIYSIYFKNKL